MEIKRSFEKVVVTKRRIVIHKTPSVTRTTCAECGEAMLMIEQAAGIFGITQRRIFRIIETGAVHFTESETGAAMICITSMKEFLETDERE